MGQRFFMKCRSFFWNIQGLVFFKIKSSLANFIKWSWNTQIGVSHPDLGHLLTRSQRSASLRLKQLHPSREFPLWAAIIIADRHAKKLKWVTGETAVSATTPPLSNFGICILRGRKKIDVIPNKILWELVFVYLK